MINLRKMRPETGDSCLNPKKTSAISVINIHPGNICPLIDFLDIIHWYYLIHVMVVFMFSSSMG